MGGLKVHSASGHAARGQAAVTDALYFLLIVTGITIFLFGFANTYGTSVDAEVVKNYNVDFTTDALKTILYSSVPRDPESPNGLYPTSEQEDKIEIDHLLAYVKEDYSDNQDLEPETKKVLGENIQGILAPISDNFDYLFFISTPEVTPVAPQKFVFLFFHKSNLQPVAPDGDGFRPLDPSEVKRDSIIGVPTGEAAYKDYYCATEPASGTGTTVDYSDLRDDLDQLIANVGDTSQSSSKIKLVKVSSGTSGTEDVPAQTDLIIWNSTILKKSSTTDSSGFETFAIENNQPPWHCITAQELDDMIASSIH